MHEAIALLETKPYKPKTVSLSQRVHALKTWALNKHSIFAGKVAAAATVFSVLILVDTTREWFISYNLPTGLITVVVALAPTLGQSAFTFMLQISGSALGYLIGLLLLTLFHNVGGYVYNPFCICIIVFFYSIPLMYIFVSYLFPRCTRPFAHLSIVRETEILSVCGTRNERDGGFSWDRMDLQGLLPTIV